MDECFDLYRKTETNPKRLAMITEKYRTRKKTQKGATSPPFKFVNMEGDTVSNNEVLGKLLYVDIGATWCGPCLREIPYFDTLYSTFEGENIVFVSICQNDKKTNWKTMVTAKKMKGIQLFADGDGGQFFSDYQVNGIPRYIIIDPNGKIVDSDAKRPSNKALIAELNELLMD